jgi:hypothetical protein
MPQILLQLAGHNGTGLGEALVNVEAVPRIGEPLYLHGFTKIEIPDLEREMARFVVHGVEIEWDEVGQRLLPRVRAQYSEVDPDDDFIYRSVEETFGRWPPFA